MTQETDQELLQRIHSGDEQAFVSLYRRRQAAIFRFALHMSGSETVAEDITQEVFLAVIRDRFGFDQARGSRQIALRALSEAGRNRHGCRSRTT